MIIVCDVDRVVIDEDCDLCKSIIFFAICSLGFRRKLGKQAAYPNLLGPMDSAGPGTSSTGPATSSSSSMMDPTAGSSYNPNPSSSSPSTSAGNYFDLSNYATSSSSSTAAAAAAASAAVNGHHSSDLYAAAALMASYSSTYPHRSHFPPTNSSCSSSSSLTTNTTAPARITDETETGSHGHFSNGVHYSSGPSQSAYFSYANPTSHPPPSASFDPHNHFYANPFAGFLDQKHALLPATLSCYDHHSASTNYWKNLRFSFSVCVSSYLRLLRLLLLLFRWSLRSFVLIFSLRQVKDFHWNLMMCNRQLSLDLQDNSLDCLRVSLFPRVHRSMRKWLVASFPPTVPSRQSIGTVRLFVSSGDGTMMLSIHQNWSIDIASQSSKLFSHW